MGVTWGSERAAELRRLKGTKISLDSTHRWAVGRTEDEQLMRLQKGQRDAWSPGQKSTQRSRAQLIPGLVQEQISTIAKEWCKHRGGAQMKQAEGAMIRKRTGRRGGTGCINATLKLISKELKTNFSRGRVAVVISHAPNHLATHVPVRHLNTRIQEFILWT